MKRILSIIICLVMLLSVFSFYASAAEGSFSSINKEVAIGSSFTTSYTVGSGEIAQAFIIITTPSQLELTSVSATAEGWTCTNKNGGYYLSSANPKAVIKGDSPLVSLTFKVLETANVGSSAHVSLSGSTSPEIGSDSNTAEGNQDISGAFSIKIAQNPNHAASAQTSSEPQVPTLSTLNIENAKISPEFNPKTFVYDVTVPYEVEKLNVNATAADPSCKITVEDTPLSETEVTSVAVRLRSSTGTSMYNLRVTREARQKNSNNQLSTISVEGFLLSPAFSPSIIEYVVWAPFETAAVNVAATPESEYSAVNITGADALKPGEFNKVTINCTSESGLVNEYYISVYRAAEGEGISTDRNVNKNEQEQEKEQEKQNNISENNTDRNNKTTKSSPLLPISLGFVTGVAITSIIALGLRKGWFKKLFTPHVGKAGDTAKDNDMFFSDSDMLTAESGSATEEPTDKKQADISDETKDDLFDNSSDNEE